MQSVARNVALLMKLIKVLVVEDQPHTRKVIRTLLLSLGVTQVLEAADGRAGLDLVCALAPDIVLLDWDMPEMNGAAFLRAVRSPATFPRPNVPIIMLTAHSERSRVKEAVRLGAHEYLLKPVSAQGLKTRIVAALAEPRPFVQIGSYYGPEPRKLATYKPVDVAFDQVYLVD